MGDRQILRAWTQKVLCSTLVRFRLGACSEGTMADMVCRVGGLQMSKADITAFTPSGHSCSVQWELKLLAANERAIHDQSKLLMFVPSDD